MDLTVALSSRMFEAKYVYYESFIVYRVNLGPEKSLGAPNALNVSFSLPIITNGFSLEKPVLFCSRHFYHRPKFSIQTPSKDAHKFN